MASGDFTHVMTGLTICNMALDQLSNQSIADFEENTEQARICKRYYDLTRREILRAHPWTFAKKTEALSLLEREHDRFRHVYKYPSDCLYVLVLFNKGRKDFYKGELEYYDISSPQQDLHVISTDVEQAYLEYIYDARDASQFSDDFVVALTHKLAYKMASPLGASTDMLRTQHSLYDEALAQAAATNSNEAKEKAHFQSKIMRARQGGADYFRSYGRGHGDY